MLKQKRKIAFFRNSNGIVLPIVVLAALILAMTAAVVFYQSKRLSDHERLMKSRTSVEETRGKLQNILNIPQQCTCNLSGIPLAKAPDGRVSLTIGETSSANFGFFTLNADSSCGNLAEKDVVLKIGSANNYAAQFGLKASLIQFSEFQTNSAATEAIKRYKAKINFSPQGIVPPLKSEPIDIDVLIDEKDSVPTILACYIAKKTTPPVSPPTGDLCEFVTYNASFPSLFCVAPGANQSCFVDANLGTAPAFASVNWSLVKTITATVLYAHSIYTGPRCSTTDQSVSVSPDSPIGNWVIGGKKKFGIDLSYSDKMLNIKGWATGWGDSQATGCVDNVRVRIVQYVRAGCTEPPSGGGSSGMGGGGGGGRLDGGNQVFPDY